jgi:[ribosomal protein S18]-alanine N-acetyltransferase
LTGETSASEVTPGAGSEPGESGEPPVVVRPMRPPDLEHVARVERASFPTSWHTQAYATELTNPAALYLVATVGETVVGFSGQWVIMDEAHITTIAVSPEWRGRRIGERILSEMLGQAIRRGATRATLEVRATNDPARRLYEKYGFVDVAVRKAYYPDNGEDAVIMWVYQMDSPAWRKRYHAQRAALGLPPDP